MKKTIFAIAFAVVSAALFAADTAAPDFNNVRRWARNTCAKSFSAKYDEGEKAIVFTADFRDRTDNCWCYPAFKLRPGEDLSKATGLKYEIKLGKESYPVPGSHLTMLKVKDKKTKYIKAPNVTEEWQTVSVKFGETPEAMKTAQHINIGMHSEEQVLVFMIRNIQPVTE